MKAPPLSARELEMIRTVMQRHPEIVSAILFGSRAKGTHTDRSDVDLTLGGDLPPLRAESIAAELDDLPLPYQFEVQPLEHIQHPPLLEHIERVGITIYLSSKTERKSDGPGRGRGEFTGNALELLSG